MVSSEDDALKRCAGGKVIGINLNQVLLMGLDFSSGLDLQKRREEKRREKGGQPTFLLSAFPAPHHTASHRITAV